MRTPEQMEKVFSYRSALKVGKPLKKFSPTSLHALITCPLRFHYQKIMGLKEPDSFSRIEMGAHDFGKFVHEGIQLLLKKYGREGKNLTIADYASMEEDWDLEAPVIWDNLPDKTSIGRLTDFPIEAALGRIMAMRFFAFMKKQPGHRWLENEYDFPDLGIGHDNSWWSVSGRADIVLEFKDYFCFLDLKTGAFQEKGKLLLKTDE
jgi:RecB family exonuclease